jgi:hypothetical protein
MALPRVRDGGDDLQLWKVAADIMNKQSLSADKQLSSWGLGEGLRTPHHKKNLLRNATQGLGIRRILCNDLGNHLVQDGDQLQSFVNTVMNLWVP